jgi:Flp pilus assembly protein TadB
LPDARTQRYVGWIAIIGVFTSCFACSLLWQNQLIAGIVFLIAAEVILAPVFVFLLRTRRRTKKVAAQIEAERAAELDALASVGRAMGQPREEGTQSKAERE